jgi:cytochrome P450
MTDTTARTDATGIDPLDLVDPARYAARGYPHDVWTRLRSEAPVARIEAPGFEPFWAVTRHAEIQQVSTQPRHFSNAQGLALTRAGAPPIPPVDMVVLLDPPRHGPMRRLVMPHLTPRAVRTRRDEVDRIAREILETATKTAGADPIDFVATVAAPFPLAIIAWQLGVPRADWPLLYRWTNEIIGKDDPEFRPPGERPGQTMKRARGEVHAYFDALIDERRGALGDDLVSVLLRATIDDAPLTVEQLLNYCELLVEAGNETTRNAITGAVLAFTEHPEQWDLLRDRRELLPRAVEEILRWVSPIIYFTRVATHDVELGGEHIRAGDRLALFFASANRDEDVFGDPFTFRVDRDPNPHLAFGIGEHFCMGANLARAELEVIFGLLLDLAEAFELAGALERLASNQNGSIKRLPIRLHGNPFSD